ncbi:ring finger protein [Phaffia rhodozyma]|uniref:Ring finger protein n=1 Tax=Phaffia rhodozyma TaxID=264483 RepID=A0A0F7SJC1_PHARH|nr:ring finger protein [Phaffia rhodozyma]
MKYSQEYARILESSGFPLEWRESAIEYKQLKKLIKKVSNELTSLGLNPVVLNRLLHPPIPAPTDKLIPPVLSVDQHKQRSSSLFVHPSESPSEGSTGRHLDQSSSVDHSEIELEFLAESSDEDEDDDRDESNSRYLNASFSSAEKGKESNAQISDDDGAHKRAVQTWLDDTGKRFRVKVRGEGVSPGESEEDDFAVGQEEAEAELAHKRIRTRNERKVRRESVAVRGGFMAEYEIGGSTNHPIPRLRLVPLHNSATSIRRKSLDSSLDTSHSPSPSSLPRILDSSPAPMHWSPSSIHHALPTDDDSRPSNAQSPQASPSLSSSSPVPSNLDAQFAQPVFNRRLAQIHLDDWDVQSEATSEISSNDPTPGVDDGPREPLMASTPRDLGRTVVQSPIWALREGSEQGFLDAGIRRGTSRGDKKSTETANVASSSSSSSSSATLTKEDDGICEADNEEDEENEEDDEDGDGSEVVPPGFTSVIGSSPGLCVPLLAIQPATPEGMLKYGGAGKPVEDEDSFELDGGGAREPSVITNGLSHQVDGKILSERVAPPQKELYIELASDLEFFNVLTHALNALDNLQRNQQAIFRKTVEHLCESISSASKPNDPTIHSKNSLGAKVKASFSKHDGYSDLYAWREIFTLWIEAEIFESGAERDRGERSIEEAEKRLKAFAGELTRRNLGDRRTLKSRDSRAAFNTFLQLNLTLLDLKKFQTANVKAARKILKKHDKRTALTAAQGFPQFVRSSLDAASGDNIKTWTLFDSSLPHVLLASLTATLLPIIPSLEDYSCLICTSIAFKPIRLDCGHLFCVRCLAKMQRRGKDLCPLCRAPVLAIANARNLDTEAMDYMKLYFPREVKIKQRENEKEVAKEDMESAGLDGKCIIC